LKKALSSEPLYIEADFPYEGGACAAHQLMREGRAVDGVFCASDMIALGFMDTLRSDYGVRIPEDISIIGFDDAPEPAGNPMN
jgi:LacI family transcriptional regulator